VQIAARDGENGGSSPPIAEYLPEGDQRMRTALSQI
jgi:hypothetical protein